MKLQAERLEDQVDRLKRDLAAREGAAATAMAAEEGGFKADRLEAQVAGLSETMERLMAKVESGAPQEELQKQKEAQRELERALADRRALVRVIAPVFSSAAPSALVSSSARLWSLPSHHFRD